jgi:hypothetical protein
MLSERKSPHPVVTNYLRGVKWPKGTKWITWSHKAECWHYWTFAKPVYLGKITDNWSGYYPDPCPSFRGKPDLFGMRSGGDCYDHRHEPARMEWPGGKLTSIHRVDKRGRVYWKGYLTRKRD